MRLVAKLLVFSCFLSTPLFAKNCPLYLIRANTRPTKLLQINPIHQVTSQLLGFGFSPDLSFFYTTKESENQGHLTMHLYDATEEVIPRVREIAIRTPIGDRVWSPDGTTLVLASTFLNDAVVIPAKDPSKPTVELKPKEIFRLEHTFNARMYIRRLQITNEGKVLIWRAYDGYSVIRVFDGTTGKEQFSFETHGGIHHTAISPDGKSLVIVRKASTTKIAVDFYNLTTGKRRGRSLVLKRHAYPFKCAFSQDNRKAILYPSFEKVTDYLEIHVDVPSGRSTPTWSRTKKKTPMYQLQPESEVNGGGHWDATVQLDRKSPTTLRISVWDTREGGEEIIERKIRNAVPRRFKNLNNVEVFGFTIVETDSGLELHYALGFPATNTSKVYVKIFSLPIDREEN